MRMDHDNKVKLFQRRLLSDDVVEYLIDQILQGTFKPGERVAELKLAHYLDVSQSTVREALRVLETKGFLKSVPFKGTFVREFKLEGLKDYFRTRTEIEMIAARWSAETDHVNANWDYMNKCVEVMAVSCQDGDHISFRKADMDFHRTLVAGADSPLLLSSWESLNHRFWAYLGIFMEKKIYNLDFQEEKHRRILSSLRENQFEEFRRELEEHFLNVDSLKQIASENSMP